MSNPMLRESKSTGMQDDFSARKFAPEPRLEQRRPRPRWRQRLVEAERGLSHSFRADSSLYRHIFLDSLLLTTCGVVGLSGTQWVIVTMGLTMMLSSELFAHGLQAVATPLPDGLRKQVVSVAAAAKLLVIAGSTSAIGLVLWMRFRDLCGG
jgi:diacylglycerol kinase